MVIFVFLILVELCFKPRLDRLETGEFILWYGRKQRKYIIL